MPAGLNRFKPEGGLNLPTLTNLFPNLLQNSDGPSDIGSPNSGVNGGTSRPSASAGFYEYVRG